MCSWASVRRDASPHEIGRDGMTMLSDGRKYSLEDIDHVDTEGPDAAQFMDRLELMPEEEAFPWAYDARLIEGDDIGDAQTIHNSALHIQITEENKAHRFRIALWPPSFTDDRSWSTDFGSPCGCSNDANACSESSTEGPASVSPARASELICRGSHGISSPDSETPFELVACRDTMWHMEALNFAKNINLMPEEEVYPWIEDARGTGDWLLWTLEDE